MKGLSFLSIVRFRDRFPKRSVERLELLAGEYQECGRKRKSLLRDDTLGIMESYSQLEKIGFLITYDYRKRTME
jgi:hypothetical protein